MKSLFVKIFSGYLFVIVLLTSLIVYFSYDTTRSHYIESSVEELKMLNKAVQYQIKSLSLKKNRHQIDSLVKRIGKDVNVRFTLLDANGEVIADSEEDPLKMESHIGRPEIKDALRKGFGSSLRFSHTVKADMLYVAMPFRGIEGNKGILRTSFFIKEMNILLRQMRSEMINIGLVVFIISLLYVLIFTGTLTRPINQLSLALRKVANGDFDVKVKIKGKNELSDMSAYFNDMTKRLKKLFEKVNSQKEELNTLLATIQDRIVVINSRREILLSNNNFKPLADGSNIYGKKIDEVVANEELNDMIREVRKSRNDFSREMLINNVWYLVSASYIDSKDEIVLFFHDIDYLRRLEEIKRDFVANVSHELKTPLTAIKGFLETIIDEINDAEHARYMDIILRHTNRLITIVNDLLTLSEVESKVSMTHKSEFDLVSHAENIARMFDTKVREKKLGLSVTSTAPVIKIYADHFKLEQLFINLIDNAVKYTETGEVTVSITDLVDKVRVEIADTGIGIPAADIERIFERFFTVDKSHSRKVGGTGLGLSIVKHIVQLHNGTIEISSREGEGTKFTVLLPKF